jgi:hypothetical protein
MLTAKLVNEVVEEFDAKHPTLVANAALRVGMSMSINGTNDLGMRPVKYA